jgi:arylsulfatase A-like enzyme
MPEIAEEAGRGVVSETPYGDDLVMEMARAAIEGNRLAADLPPDLLAISFSSPDHIGHRFGPASREVQDTYLRLDLLLAEFLNDLDEKYGIENVLVFLTSDHGAAHTPTYMKEKNIPAGYFSQSDAAEQLRDHLEDLYGMDPVLDFRRFQVYLDRELIEQEGLSLEEIQQETARFLPAVEGIKGAMTSREITTGDFDESFHNIVQRGYYPVRSGDVLYWLDPQWMGTRTSGTTHGAPYSYDTRAPMIWYGWDIPVGRTTEPVYITDIAATLAIFLNTPYPNGNTGTPMNHFMRK